MQGWNRAFAMRAVWALMFVVLAIACGPGKKALAPRSQTFGELRAIRGAVTVTPPGEAMRPLVPRERLVDGEKVSVPANALAWLRRDGGATMLIRGPASIGFRADDVEIDEGMVFIDSPGDLITTVVTKQGTLRLTRVRASLEVDPKAAATRAYVLAGEVRISDGPRAGPGELLTLTGADGTKAEVKPAIAWTDWTGGLATTDQSAAPPPFGVGTVGARPPGDQGAPRIPLTIRRMDVRVTIDGDLATTEVDQMFFNGASAKVEGIYTFRTPAGAVLQRFGVDRDDVLVWGRVKEKAAAAKQYKSHVYEGSLEDPALLEWDAPGVYRARLYPIDPGATRRVVVRYTEWLGRTGPNGSRRLYVFPMAAEGAEESLPHIEFFGASFDLSRAGAKEVRTGMKGSIDKNKVIVRAHDLVPRADLAVELFDEGTVATHMVRSSHGIDEELIAPSDRVEARKRARGEPDYLLVPIRPTDVPRPEGGLDLIVVVDTSAAMDDASLSIARASVSAMLAHMSEGDRALVWAGDASLRPVVKGWHELRKVDEAARRDAVVGLATLERGGATDLGAMLAQAAAGLDPARRGAVVYIGDGRPTVGELALSDLRDRLDKLPRPVRIFGLGVGLDADMGILDGIVRAGFAERVGDAASAARASLRLLEVAERPAWLGVSLDLGPSIERLVPRDLNALVADESVLVVGRINGALPKQIRLTTPNGDKSIRVLPMRAHDNGDLQSRWATGRLRQLLADGVGRAALVDLGVRTGIITPFTSLYVPTKSEMTPEERDELRRKQRTLGFLEPARPDRRTAWLGGLPWGLAGCSKLERAARTHDEPAAAPAEQAPADLPPTTVAADKPAASPKPSEDKESNDESAAEKSKAAEEPEADSKSWGRDDSLGADPMSARGNLWGDQVGEAFGAGGLGLSGVGEGGGGKGDGVGLGAIGTTGHGAGTGTGQGFGSGHGRLGGSHRSRPPRVRMGATTVNGSLPPEVIARIVRQNFGRFRLCYEAGLRNNPNLQGRVSTRFVIARDGAVSTVANAGSDLPDAGVVQCVTSAFNGLTFPQPEAGIVTVVYPILFTPGDGAPPKPDDGEAASAEAPAEAPSTGLRVTVQIGVLPHSLLHCSGAANIPFGERVTLWRERLVAAKGQPAAVSAVYRQAVSDCEAPTWRERAKLQSMMLDAIPSVNARVELWRMFGGGLSDALYRGILARVRTPQEMRELHDALGLKSIDPGVLEKVLRDVKDPVARVNKLRALLVEWPDDFVLALRLLDAFEDASDDAGARELARRLRARPDADAHVRTEVGELYLRLAKRAGSKEQAAADEAEARRTFGEIVEYAPDEPIARRRLGDLLRAHGWYSEASRQYETLARLSPDDPGVQLLTASAAQGLGKLDEAVRWAEKVSGVSAPGDAQGLSRTARALAATFLAWGRDAAKRDGRKDEVAILRNRTTRLLDADDRASGSVRAVLLWSHPELHPTLWSSALGSMMPAPEGDVTLGLSQVILPRGDGIALEVRLEPQDAEHVARLGAVAVLTLVFHEGQDNEKVVKLPVVFQRGGPPTIRFNVRNEEVQP